MERKTLYTLFSLFRYHLSLLLLPQYGNGNRSYCRLSTGPFRFWGPHYRELYIICRDIGKILTTTATVKLPVHPFRAVSCHCRCWQSATPVNREEFFRHETHTHGIRGAAKHRAKQMTMWVFIHSTGWINVSRSRGSIGTRLTGQC